MLQCATVRNSDSAATESGQLNTPYTKYYSLRRTQLWEACRSNELKFDKVYRKLY
jgi:hypothetical protein